MAPKAPAAGDRQLLPRPGAGAREDVIGQAEPVHRFIRRVLLRLRLQGIRLLQQAPQRLLAQHGDDGAPVHESVIAFIL